MPRLQAPAAAPAIAAPATAPAVAPATAAPAQQQQQEQQQQTIPWVMPQTPTPGGAITGLGLGIGNALMGNQLGAFLGFPQAMQGAMGQMWEVNRANQAASLALRAIQAERERTQMIGNILGQQPSVAAPSLANLPMPTVSPGAVMGGGAIPVRGVPASAFAGFAPSERADLGQMAGQQATEAALQTRALANMAGAPAEAQQQLAAQQQREQAYQAARSLAMQIYGRSLEDELARRRMGMSLV